MTATHTTEISGVPYLRPVPHPDEAAALLAEYPVVVACDCTGILESSTHMVRDTSMDARGDTARGRFRNGCHEIFHCPACGEAKLFPPTGQVTYVRDEWPEWGSAVPGFWWRGGAA